MARIIRLSILSASLIFLFAILLPGRSPASGQAVDFSPTPEPATPTLSATPEYSATPTLEPSQSPAPPLATSLPASPSVSPTAPPAATETTTPTPTPTPGPALTETPIPGIADETEPTLTPSATATDTTTPGNPVLSFPLIIRQPTVTPTLTPTIAPVEQLLVCRSPDVVIPDNNLNGVSDTIQINDSRVIQDLDLRLDITHPFTSDLVVNLTHVSSGTTVNLLNRPGSGCSRDDITAILDDDASLQGNSQCASNSSYPYPPTIGGIFQPNQALNAINNLTADGGWRLTVSDQGPSDTGTLRSWCIYTQVGSPVTPTPAPPAPLLPSRAHVSGTTTHMQKYPLDCESRVAVDYAAFFGVRINEDTFFNRLPRSNNPDRGFVGNVMGTWGQIPPNAYGVHAEPVAALLRDFGVTAYAHKGMSWDELRAEIAAGKPVFVWDVGAVYTGWPTYYTPSDGNVTIVANYQHVVQVIGYDLAENIVEIHDNGNYYQRTIAQFLRSWSALDNMAIISHP